MLTYKLSWSWWCDGDDGDDDDFYGCDAQRQSMNFNCYIFIILHCARALEKIQSYLVKMLLLLDVRLLFADYE